jgi:hypothetical protein
MMFATGLIICKRLKHMVTTTNPTHLASGEYAAEQAPLPSWNEGSTNKASSILSAE